MPTLYVAIKICKAGYAPVLERFWKTLASKITVARNLRTQTLEVPTNELNLCFFNLPVTAFYEVLHVRHMGHIEWTEQEIIVT